MRKAVAAVFDGRDMEEKTLRREPPAAGRSPSRARDDGPDPPFYGADSYWRATGSMRTTWLGRPRCSTAR